MKPLIYLLIAFLGLNSYGETQAKPSFRETSLDKINSIQFVAPPILTASKLIVCGQGYPTTLTVTGCSGTVNWFTDASYIQWAGGSPSGNTATAYIYDLTKFHVSCTENGETSESSDSLGIDFARVAIHYEAEPENFICTGGRVQLEAQAFPDTGIVSYKWYLNSYSITDSIDNSIHAENPGTYKVDVTYSDGCQIYTSNASAINLVDAGVIPQPNIIVVDSAISGKPVKIFDRRFGNNSTHAGLDIIKDNSDNYVIAGEAVGNAGGGDQSEQSKGPVDFWVVKIDNTGNKIWDKIIGGTGSDRISKIVKSSDDDYLLFGTSASNISGDRTVANSSSYPLDDIWVVKINTNGVKKWDKKYGGTLYDEAKDALALPNNEYLIAGSSNSNISGEVTNSRIGNYDFWLVKIDSAGNKIWDRRYGGMQNDKLQKVLKAQNGDYILVGTSSSSIGWDKSQSQIGYDDIWIIRTDANGNKIWDKTLGSTYPDSYVDAQIDQNDDLVFGFTGDSENSHFYKLDNSGNTLWEKHYSGMTISGKVILNEKGFLHVGRLSYASNNNSLFNTSIRGYSDGYIVQFDSTGNKIWEKLLGGSEQDGFNGFLKEGNVLTLVGTSRSPVSFEKSQIPRGVYDDLWIIQTALNQEIANPYAIDSAQAIHIFANNCPGQLEWSGGASGYSSAITVHPTAQTTYTAKCNAYGCSTTSNIEVSINCSNDFRIVAIENGLEVEKPTSCSESSIVNLEAKGCSGTVTWFNGAIDNTIEVSILSDSIFLATCSNTGCSSVSDSISVLLFKKPILSLDGPATFCTGGSTSLQVTHPEPGGSYQWYKNGAAYLSLESLVLNVTETGTFKAKVTKGNCSSYSEEIQITAVTQIPDPPTFESTNVYTCLGNSTILTALGCEMGLTKWSNGYTGSTIQTPNINSPLTYTATCTINTCISDESNLVNVKIAKVAIAKNGTNIPCDTSDFTLNSVIESNPSSFQWYRNNTLLNFEIRDSLTSNLNGSYFLKIKSNNGCEVNSNILNIQQNIFLPPLISSAIESGVPKDTILQLWDRSYGGTSSDWANDIIRTQDDNLLIVGTSYSDLNGNKTTQNKGQSDMYIVKIDTLGNKIWDTSFGTSLYDEATSATISSDGNILVIGTSYTANDGDKTDASLGGTDFWLLKIDQNGTKIWDKVYGTNKHESYGKILKTTDNNYLIYGTIRALNYATSEYFSIKIDINGNIIWSKTFTGGAEDQMFSATNTQDGGYIFGGRSTSGQNLDKTQPSFGTSDIWLIKTDVNGNKVWDRSYGGAAGDVNSGISELPNGSFVISGTSYSPSGGNKTSGNLGLGDYWLLKIDYAGNLIWDRNYGGNKDEQVAGLYLRPNGRILIFGRTFSDKSNNISEHSYGGYDGWLIEVDSLNGDIIWDKRIGGDKTDLLKGYIEFNSNTYLISDSHTGQNGSKTYPSYGDSDFWLTNLRRTDTIDFQSSVKLTFGQSLNLFASNCQGDISWPNGSQQASILVSPAVTTTYTAECTAFGCTTESSIKVNVYTCEEYISLTVSDNIMTGTSISPINKNAYSKIEATNQIGDIGTDASAKYTSGGSIELNNGFKVEAGSIFKAEISPSPCHN
ncbi:3-coathanger stack domain-containing protein [Arcticibacterium luteifluviistationis]|uniref:Ig-like domain-containing protein n=1 Tax=Arcticibacterium luteifluviistationis TaxID=1784714 RepID=A0A2Z4GI05_9BACT|nr:3-coathanger stack domain-containing protein [Arcticibacterium luteifluviistationis]AWW00645.1 hypothetical protein DJ013_21640 [Arcticibacterium luteifluviistationis]